MPRGLSANSVPLTGTICPHHRDNLSPQEGQNQKTSLKACISCGIFLGTSDGKIIFHIYKAEEMRQERKRKVRHVREHTEIDQNTGEIKKYESTTVSVADTEPPYVKLYIEDISKLYDLPASGKDLIYALIRIMDYRGYISLNKAYKDIICKEIGIQDKTFRNTISKLIKKEVLKLIGKGLYEMNPNLFAKGTWQEIQKRRNNFRLIIDYSYDGDRKINGEVADDQKTSCKTIQ